MLRTAEVELARGKAWIDVLKLIRVTRRSCYCHA